ncbi:hypothetical protein H6F47_02820 [Sphaerospermopsis sp. FACHB-1094]|nr:hypothetical protein [Sphaerospermopsis sp. FACHB-1094]MBD2131415.1 hypothetical protein [Sphaerospermopsis sp. FACHB-1094]
MSESSVHAHELRQQSSVLTLPDEVLLVATSPPKQSGKLSAASVEEAH